MQSLQSEVDGILLGLAAETVTLALAGRLMKCFGSANLTVRDATILNRPSPHKRWILCRALDVSGPALAK
jgi:hypothetical protein